MTKKLPIENAYIKRICPDIDGYEIFKKQYKDKIDDFYKNKLIKGFLSEFIDVDVIIDGFRTEVLYAVFFDIIENSATFKYLDSENRNMNNNTINGLERYISIIYRRMFEKVLKEGGDMLDFNWSCGENRSADIQTMEL